VSDRQRFAVAPTLAALAERAGWEFELYYDDVRAGRHFGGGPPEDARPGWAAGTLVAGGRHAGHVRRLSEAFEVVALGDPGSVLWPALERAETLTRTAAPMEIYEAAFDRLGEPLPDSVLVVDGSPQGANGLIVAPFLYPAFLSGPPVLGLEASADRLGERSHQVLYGDVGEESYATLTAALAERHAAWGEGIIIGDPDLIAAQLPRARRRRLVPLYGRPQIDVLRATAPLVRAAAEPVWGRQYDDRDFFELAALGHGLQVLDPDPPFGASPGAAVPAVVDDPSDDELRAWAADGRVLATLLFWAGMVREEHCLAPIVDLVAVTGLRAGIVLTVPALEAADPAILGLLGAPPERGGVAGRLEPLAGSTGFGVAAESELPEGMLAQTLADARASGLAVRGWWPLLDAPLVARPAPRIERRGFQPVVRFTSRRQSAGAGASDASDASDAARRDVRGLAGDAVRRLGLDRFFVERRPFDDRAPGAFDRDLAESVRAAGFEYMWTKAAFGEPRAAFREDGFVALPFTAGNWDGWSPFYTVGSAGDVAAAERRLLRGGPGWLASTVDSPLFLLPGELLEHGARLYEVADLVAQGGRSGRLVNVTPNVIARYARLF
jgi:hypothetical protein